MSREFDELAGAFARNSAKGNDREKILERAKKKMSKLKKEGDKENAAKDCVISQIETKYTDIADHFRCIKLFQFILRH